MRRHRADLSMAVSIRELLELDRNTQNRRRCGGVRNWPRAIQQCAGLEAPGVHVAPHFSPSSTSTLGKVPSDDIADGELQLYFLLGGFLHGVLWGLRRGFI